MATKERLLMFLREIGVSNSSAEKLAELPNGTINNSKGEFNSDTIFKIKKAYYDLNLNWLIAEEGKMLKSATVGHATDESFSPIKENIEINSCLAELEQEKQKNAYLERIIKDKEQIINLLTNKHN